MTNSATDLRRLLVRIGLAATAVAAITLAACSGGSEDGTVTSTSVAATEATTTSEASPTATSQGSPVATSPAATAAAGVTSTEVPDTVVTIDLNDGDPNSDAASVAFEDGTVTIFAGGAFRLTGTLPAGGIVVEAPDEAAVWLILDGVDITNPTGAAIAVLDASEAYVVLEDGTTNRLADGPDYVFADPEEDEPNATLFSKTDLTIDGSGALIVDAAYNDAIVGKDHLVILAGDLTITAADDGIRGRDSLVISGGSFVIDASGDGLKSNNDEDATLGYVSIVAGTFDITAADDAIQAETDLFTGDGRFQLTSGGGANASLGADDSAKAVKAANSVVIEGGSFTIDAADDAVHSNNAITINGGTFDIATGDDAFHADETLDVNAGEINISTSYEGLESAVITINGGDIQLVSTDDGLNVAGGADASGQQGRGGRGRDAFAASGDYLITINGGRILIDAAGDGIDANGSIVMTDGYVVVHGPTEQFNSALDFDGTFELSGGFLVAAGSARMAQAPGAASTQPSLAVQLSNIEPGGTVIEVVSSEGEALLVFESAKAFQVLVFSSPDLVDGETYEVAIDVTPAGDAVAGVYTAATGGTILGSVVAS